MIKKSIRHKFFEFIGKLIKSDISNVTQSQKDEATIEAFVKAWTEAVELAKLVIKNGKKVRIARFKNVMCTLNDQIHRLILDLEGGPIRKIEKKLLQIETIATQLNDIISRLPVKKKKTDLPKIQTESNSPDDDVQPEIRIIEPNELVNKESLENYLNACAFIQERRKFENSIEGIFKKDKATCSIVSISAPHGKTQSAFTFNKFKPLYFVEVDPHSAYQPIYDNYANISRTFVEYVKEDIEAIENNLKTGNPSSQLALWSLGLLVHLAGDARANFKPQKSIWMKYHAMERAALKVKPLRIGEHKKTKKQKQTSKKSETPKRFAWFCLFLDDFNDQVVVRFLLKLCQAVDLPCVLVNKHKLHFDSIDMRILSLNHCDPVKYLNYFIRKRKRVHMKLCSGLEKFFGGLFGEKRGLGPLMFSQCAFLIFSDSLIEFLHLKLENGDKSKGFTVSIGDCLKTVFQLYLRELTKFLRIQDINKIDCKGDLITLLAKHFADKNNTKPVEPSEPDKVARDSKIAELSKSFELVNIAEPSAIVAPVESDEQTSTKTETEPAESIMSSIIIEPSSVVTEAAPALVVDPSSKPSVWTAQSVARVALISSHSTEMFKLFTCKIINGSCLSFRGVRGNEFLFNFIANLTPNLPKNLSLNYANENLSSFLEKCRFPFLHDGPLGVFDSIASSNDFYLKSLTDKFEIQFDGSPSNCSIGSELLLERIDETQIIANSSLNIILCESLVRQPEIQRKDVRIYALEKERSENDLRYTLRQLNVSTTTSCKIVIVLESKVIVINDQQ